MTRRVTGRSDLVDVAAKLLRQTDLAFLIDTGSEEVWVPRSEVEHDGEGTFTMPEWLALKKGLI